MKITITILLTVILNVFAKGQETDYCSYLQQFEGEWKSVNGSQTITIYLKAHRKITTHGNILFTQDCLVGWHDYKVNNTVVESDYQNRFIILPLSFDNFLTYSIFLTFDKTQNTCEAGSRKLSGSIIDYNQSNEMKTVNAIVNTAGTTMTWTQQQPEWYGARSGAYGMTLPASIVFIKQ